MRAYSTTHPKLLGQWNWCQLSMTKYSHNMRLVNPLCPVKQRFDWSTQAAVTAWVWSRASMTAVRPSTDLRSSLHKFIEAEI